MQTRWNARVVGKPVAGFTEGHRVATVDLDVSTPVRLSTTLTVHCDVDDWLALADGAEVVLEGKFEGDTWRGAKMRMIET